MQKATQVFVLTLVPAILLTDWLVSWLFGYQSTITGVVRDWASESTWPEFVYVLGTVILYLHLFKGWPDGR